MLIKRNLLQGGFVRIILILLFTLFPSVVFGGVGDIYYCTGKNTVRIEGYKVKQYNPQNFKFKRLENNIKFGSDKGYLQNVVLNKKILSLQETFTFTEDTNVGIMNYENGIFHFTMNGFKHITIITMIICFVLIFIIYNIMYII